MKRRDFLTVSAGLVGSMLPGLGRAQSRPCPPPLLGATGGSSATTVCSAVDALADWVARSTGPGVVWGERFNDPVNWNRWFTWTAGNQPAAINRIANDGIMGDGCWEHKCTQTILPSNGFVRPMKPVGGGGVVPDDVNRPGLYSDGTVIRNTAENRNHYNNGKGGFFGHISYHNDSRWAANHPSPLKAFIGEDYYIQYRVKFSPNRFTVGETPGKIAMINLIYGRTPNQELVHYAGTSYGSRWFRQYTSVGSQFNSFLDPSQENNQGQSLQPGGPYNNTCLVGIGDLSGNPAYCWLWPLDEWVTVLTHFIPGQQYLATPALNPANDPVRNTGIEIWVAPQSRINAGLGYLKIWDFKKYVWLYEPYGSGGNSYIADGTQQPWGAGWVALNAFNGGASLLPSVQPAGWWHRYDQIIMSNQFIPCPVV